jgi:hypothetical protein
VLIKVKIYTAAEGWRARRICGHEEDLGLVHFCNIIRWYLCIWSVVHEWTLHTWQQREWKENGQFSLPSSLLLSSLLLRRFIFDCYYPFNFGRVNRKLKLLLCIFFHSIMELEWNEGGGLDLCSLTVIGGIRDATASLRWHKLKLFIHKQQHSLKTRRRRRRHETTQRTQGKRKGRAGS